MSDHSADAANTAKDNLPFTDSSRFHLGSGRYHIRRDNEQEQGFEAIYQLQPGVLLRVMDLTILSGKPVPLLSPAKRLMFNFKVRGDHQVEFPDGTMGAITEGSLWFNYNDEEQEMLDICESGEPFLLVSMLCEPDTLMLPPFELEAAQLPEVVQKVLEGQSLVTEGFSMGPELLQSLRMLLDSDTTDSVGRPYLRAKSVEILCLALRDILQQENQRGQAHISKREQQKMSEARRLLQKQWQNPPSQDELVQLLGIGKSRLKECFKWLFGYSISDYVMRIRMQQAQQLLTESNLNVSQVAWEVGYEHPCNFVTAFKRQFGMTPKAFQKAGRERQRA
ncbi:helix-turn-helix transcriptional regulator [Pseudomaricurvus alkylphenolicus]|uniref:helix-turn-helix domain-containing protein n=1 Tax=Pseudomaricurvus alkylphenolicus TaxID=1306991 RepID=UPI0014247D9A|nr:AraC family transcriptional regulator [Pseudomaricurvus alkylphenolicus]NIB41556.1 helix-turn-helix transcriptional regulator [Pseudomaricurvus alkylphenolicus]